MKSTDTCKFQVAIEFIKHGAPLREALNAEGVGEFLDYIYVCKVWSRATNLRQEMFTCIVLASACSAQAAACLKVGISTEFFASYILHLYGKVKAVSGNTEEAAHALKIAMISFEKEMQALYASYARRVDVKCAKGMLAIFLTQQCAVVKMKLEGEIIKYYVNACGGFTINFEASGLLLLVSYFSTHGFEEHGVTRRLLGEARYAFIEQRCQHYCSILLAKEDNMKCDVKLRQGGYDILRKAIIKKDFFINLIGNLGYDVRASNNDMGLKGGLIELALEHGISHLIIAHMASRVSSAGYLQEIVGDNSHKAQLLCKSIKDIECFKGAVTELYDLFNRLDADIRANNFTIRNAHTSLKDRIDALEQLMLKSWALSEYSSIVTILRSAKQKIGGAKFLEAQREAERFSNEIAGYIRKAGNILLRVGEILENCKAGRAEFLEAQREAEKFSNEITGYILKMPNISFEVEKIVENCKACRELSEEDVEALGILVSEFRELAEHVGKGVSCNQEFLEYAFSDFVSGIKMFKEIKERSVIGPAEKNLMRRGVRETGGSIEELKKVRKEYADYTLKLHTITNSHALVQLNALLQELKAVMAKPDALAALERARDERTIELIQYILTEREDGVADLTAIASIRFPGFVQRLKESLSIVEELVIDIRKQVEPAQNQIEHITDRMQMIFVALHVLQGMSSNELELFRDDVDRRWHRNPAAIALQKAEQVIANFEKVSAVYKYFVEDIGNAEAVIGSKGKMLELSAVVDSIVVLVTNAREAIFRYHREIKFYLYSVGFNKEERLSQVKQLHGDSAEEVKHAERYLDEAKSLCGHLSLLEHKAGLLDRKANAKNKEVQHLRGDIFVLKLPKLASSIRKLLNTTMQLASKAEKVVIDNNKSYGLVAKITGMGNQIGFIYGEQLEKKFIDDTNFKIAECQSKSRALNQKMLKILSHMSEGEIGDTITFAGELLGDAVVSMENLMQHILMVLNAERSAIHTLMGAAEDRIKTLKESRERFSQESNKVIERELGKAMRAFGMIQNAKNSNDEMIKEMQVLAEKIDHIVRDIDSLDLPLKGVFKGVMEELAEAREPSQNKPYQERLVNKTLLADIKFRGEIRNASRSMDAIKALESAMEEIRLTKYSMKRSIKKCKPIIESASEIVEENDNKIAQLSGTQEQLQEQFQNLEAKFKQLIQEHGVNKDTEKMMLSIGRLQKILNGIREIDEKLLSNSEENYQRLRRMDDHIEEAKAAFEDIYSISMADPNLLDSTEAIYQKVKEIGFVELDMLKNKIEAATKDNGEMLRKRRKSITKALGTIKKLENTIKILSALSVPEFEIPIMGQKPRQQEKFKEVPDDAPQVEEPDDQDAPFAGSPENSDGEVFDIAEKEELHEPVVEKEQFFKAIMQENSALLKGQQIQKPMMFKESVIGNIPIKQIKATESAAVVEKEQFFKAIMQENAALLKGQQIQKPMIFKENVISKDVIEVKEDPAIQRLLLFVNNFKQPKRSGSRSHLEASLLRFAAKQENEISAEALDALRAQLSTRPVGRSTAEIIEIIKNIKKNQPESEITL